jgi:hypothetical protein
MKTITFSMKSAILGLLCSAFLLGAFTYSTERTISNQLMRSSSDECREISWSTTRFNVRKSQTLQRTANGAIQT